MSGPREVEVGSVEGQPVRARLPLYTKLFGIEAVVISAADYARLLDVEARQQGSTRKAKRPPAPSRLEEQDAEVAAFVRDRLAEGLAIWRIEDAALRTFGKERAPSWSAIQRYRLKVLAPAERSRQPAPIE